VKAVKDADPAGIVEEECLDICGGFILSYLHSFFPEYLNTSHVNVCARVWGVASPSQSQKT
jgi:hypothetical protein